MLFHRTSCLIVMLSLAASAFAAEEPAMRKSVSQYGITWTFSQEAMTGQFITGDWWVVGPVTVETVSPTPGKAQAEAAVDAKSIYGAAGMKADDQMRNGSMIPVKSLPSQGYDSRLVNYKPELSVSFPVDLDTNTSLVSTISGMTDGKKPLQLFHERMWSKETHGTLALKTAAVLTVLPEAPPVDAFRPPYAGTEKPIYTWSQVKTDKLLGLKPVKDTPKFAEFARYLERPWLDHTSTWLHQMTGPSENQVNYGREFARITGMSALMLNTDAPMEEKKPLLIGMIQLGIDLYGGVNAGRSYQADGGHYSGRKFPILFAGVLLGDERMQHPGRLTNFAEDQQTYYGTGWAGQDALFQMVVHTGPKPPYMEKSPSTWDKDDQRSDGYRTVNGTAWPATALAVQLMDLTDEWNHDAFFDVVDHWMARKDEFAANRTSQPDAKYAKRNGSEGKTFDDFTDQMWAAYRDQATPPSGKGAQRKWVWDQKRWEPNERPSQNEITKHLADVKRQTTSK